MNSIYRRSALFVVLGCCAVTTGCGSSSTSSTPPAGQASAPSPSATSTSASAPATSTAAGSPAALSAEAGSAATGDIPDNQVFLSLRNAHAGYSMKYPEGWTIQGSGTDSVTISDKNNLVRVVVARAPAPTTASAASALSALKRANPTLKFTPPTSFSLPASSRAVKVVYTTSSAPNQVTGKRIELIVDRYVLAGPGGRVATVDLGTPKGVDNVDAYRMMIQSFTWR